MTIQEIKALTDYQKEIFATKEDVVEIKEGINTLTTSVDAISRKLDDHHLEISSLNNRANRHEGWINKIAKKTNVALDY